MRVRRQARRAPDEPRLEGARRAADRPDRRRDRERDPRRDRRRRPRAADHARGDAARAPRRAREGEGVELLRPSSLDELDGGLVARRRHRGRAAAARRARSQAETLVDIRGVVPRGIDGHTDRRRHDARRARGRARDPGGAPRGLPARRVAAAPQHGHDRRQPAPGDALLVLAPRVPVPPPRRRPLPRARGRAPRARDLRERASARRRIRRIRRGGAARARRAAADDRRELPLAELYRLPTEDDRSTTTLEPGELILELERAAAGGEHVPEGDGPAALGVPARRRRGGSLRRRGAARARRRGADPVAPRSPDALDAATPLPGHGVQGRGRPRARRGARSKPSRRFVTVPGTVTTSVKSPATGAPPGSVVTLLCLCLAPGHGRSCSRPGGVAVRVAEASAPARAGARARASAGRRRRRRRPRCARARDDAPTVHCPDWELGPGASLRCGLPRCRARPRPRSSSSPTGRISTRARSTASSRPGGPAAETVVAASYGGTRLHPGAARAAGLERDPGRGRRGLDGRPRPVRRSEASRRRRFRR